MPEGGPRVITADDLVERTGDDVVQGGLQRVESAAPTGEKLDGDVVMAASGDAQPALETPTTTETLEQQALRAVLASGNEDASSSRNMTIDLQTDTLNLLDRPPGDETDAFRQDILTRPEESTMEDYSVVPIESFGAALLRGMGWNPGSGPNPKVHEPKRRPAGLGLGASEKPGSERAQPGKKNETASRTERDRKRKEDYATRGGRGYIPVVKRARVRRASLSRQSRPVSRPLMRPLALPDLQESHMDGSSSRAESPASSVVQARSRASSRSPSPRSDTSRRLERDPRDRSVGLGVSATGNFKEPKLTLWGSRNGDRVTQRRGDDRSARDRDRDHGSSRRREDESYRSSRREEKGSRYDSERDHERDRDRYRDKARDRGDRDRRPDKDRDYDRRR